MHAPPRGPCIASSALHDTRRCPGSTVTLPFPPDVHDTDNRNATVEGVAERVLFHDIRGDNPFTIVRVRQTQGTAITVVGPIDEPRINTTYRFVGEWVAHPEYGRQLKAFWFEEVLPNTAREAEKYLASGIIKGVKKGLARRIVQALGGNALHVIDATPERLSEVSGIRPELRGRIVEALEQNRGTRRVMSFLASHDVTPALAQKIHRAFGNRTIEIITRNPYRMADEVPGVSFKISDSIAQRVGIATENQFRLRSGLLYALKQAEDEGHVYLPREVLLERAAGLLGVEATALSEPLDSAVATERIKIDEDAAYLTHHLHLETRIAEEIGRRVAHAGRPLPDDADVAKIEEQLGGISLAGLQRECLRRSLTCGVFIMTGGPGTGKTTTIRSLLLWCEKLGLTVSLAAPTGRAARRLAQASATEARTLHRLLEYAPAEHTFNRNRERPLDADVAIVDEASMIDAWLFASLLDALPEKTNLVLVGDVDQLPSVGAGCILRDLIGSGRVPTIFLNEIFRQGEGSLIVRNSHRLLRGELPLPSTSDGDFFFIQKDDVNEVAATVIDLCATRLPKHYGFNAITDVQVISPMYRGEAGVHNLNARLQERLNPASGDASGEVPLSNGRARIGDKVMQIRNNYELNVFNGDMGVVSSVDTDRRNLTVRLLGGTSETVTYSFEEALELVLAYACSVHKSQGSEFPAVVIPLTTQHFVMLVRNLFYTAITRARKLVVVVGSRKALQIAIGNDRVEKRFTRLARRIQTTANRDAETMPTLDEPCSPQRLWCDTQPQVPLPSEHPPRTLVGTQTQALPQPGAPLPGEHAPVPLAGSPAGRDEAPGTSPPAPPAERTAPATVPRNSGSVERTFVGRETPDGEE